MRELLKLDEHTKIPVYIGLRSGQLLALQFLYNPLFNIAFHVSLQELE